VNAQGHSGYPFPVRSGLALSSRANFEWDAVRNRVAIRPINAHHVFKPTPHRKPKEVAWRLLSIQFSAGGGKLTSG